MLSNQPNADTLRTNVTLNAEGTTHLFGVKMKPWEVSLSYLDWVAFGIFANPEEPLSILSDQVSPTCNRT
jgi:hypothetical protein